MLTGRSVESRHISYVILKFRMVLYITNKVIQPTLGGINAREWSAVIPLNQSSINETQMFDTVYNSFSCPLREAVE